MQLRSLSITFIERVLDFFQDILSVFFVKFNEDFPLKFLDFQALLIIGYFMLTGYLVNLLLMLLEIFDEEVDTNLSGILFPF